MKEMHEMLERLKNGQITWDEWCDYVLKHKDDAVNLLLINCTYCK